MLELFSKYSSNTDNQLHDRHLGGRNEKGIQSITIQCNKCYDYLKVAWPLLQIPDQKYKD